MLIISDILKWLDLSRLTKRLVEEDGLGDEAYVTSVIEEYKKFYFMFSSFCKLNDEPPNLPFVPSAPVDIVWQRHMLDTMAYMADCKKWGIRTSYLHRFRDELQNLKQNQEDVKEKMNIETLQDGYKSTLKAYEAVFGTSAPENIWSLELETTKCYVSYTFFHIQKPITDVIQIIDADDLNGETNKIFMNKLTDELLWLGKEVYLELPKKQLNCKKQPLNEIYFPSTGKSIENPEELHQIWLVVHEYVRFLVLIMLRLLEVNICKEHLITPSKLVDELWHAHILHTFRYFDFWYVVLFYIIMLVYLYHYGS